MVSSKAAIVIQAFSGDAERVRLVAQMEEQLSSWRIPYAVSWDDGVLGAAGNAKASWELGVSRFRDVEWLGVFSDDSLLCEDFDYGLARCINAVGRKTDHLTFMDWTRASVDLKERGGHWLRGARLWYPARMMRARLVPLMLEWIDSHLRDSSGRWPKNKDDWTEIAWMKVHGYSSMCPVPTLVQHACPNSSTIGHDMFRNMKNVRVCKYPVEGSAAQYDWPHGVDSPLRHSAGEPTLKWIEETFKLEGTDGSAR